MENVVQLDDDHRRAQLLLPWYVTGRLDPAETRQLEAHLNGCAECQAELASERILQAEYAAMPVDAESGWAKLRSQIAPEARRRTRFARLANGLGDRLRHAISGWSTSEPWMRWGLVAQSCALVLFVGLAVRPALNSALAPAPAPVADYHALSAAASDTTANVAVMFRPDTSERQLRAELSGVDARVVGGPTAAAVYLLHVPAAQRSAAIARLHASTFVTLAEPVDAGETR
jgi:hypothetical protein